MLAAFLAGEIQMVFDSPAPPSCRTSRAARLRPIAVTTAERSRTCRTCRPRPRRAFQDHAPFWLGVVAPGGTPPAIVDKLNAAFRESLRRRRRARGSTNLGADIEIGTPEEFRKMLAEELALWTGVAKAANIQMD